MANRNSTKTFTTQITASQQQNLEPNSVKSVLNPPGQSTDQTATLNKEGLVRD